MYLLDDGVDKIIVQNYIITTRDDENDEIVAFKGFEQVLSGLCVNFEKDGFDTILEYFGSFHVEIIEEDYTFFANAIDTKIIEVDKKTAKVLFGEI